MAVKKQVRDCTDSVTALFLLYRSYVVTALQSMRSSHYARYYLCGRYTEKTSLWDVRFGFLAHEVSNDTTPYCILRALVWVCSKEGTAHAQSRDMHAHSRSQAGRFSCKMATSAKARRSFVNVSKIKCIGALRCSHYVRTDSDRQELRRYATTSVIIRAKSLYVLQHHALKTYCSLKV